MQMWIRVTFFLDVSASVQLYHRRFVSPLAPTFFLNPLKFPMFYFDDWTAADVPSVFFFFTLRGFGPLGLFFFRKGWVDVDVLGSAFNSGNVAWRVRSSFASFALRVVSLGGSRTMTERLMWTIGAAGILRSFTRSGCDWVATTYRCLLSVPMMLVKHSSPGIASRWLHLLRSNVFAKSTADCCSLPCRYNSCMQHCVIIGLTSPWRTE